jgi:hypothetical protein
MGLLDDAIREHLDLQRRRGADPAQVERAEREALGPVRRMPTETAQAEAEGDRPDGYEPEDDLDHDQDDGLAYDHEEDQGWSEPSRGESPDRPGPPAFERPPLAPEDQPTSLHEPLAPEDQPTSLHEPFAGESPRGSLEPDAEDDPFREAEDPFAEDRHAGPAEPPARSSRTAPGPLDDPEDDPFAEAGPEPEPPRSGATPPPHPAAGPPAPPPKQPEDVLGQETAEYHVEGALEAEKGKQDEDVLEETPEFLQDTPDHDRLWFEQRPPRDFDFDG